MASLRLVASDLDESTAFYRTLFERDPVKRYDDLAIFCIDGLTLELSHGEAPAALNDAAAYGVLVPSTDNVVQRARRLEKAGVAIDLRIGENCCHVLQTKVWVRDPEGRRWKIYAALDEITHAGRRSRALARFRSFFERDRLSVNDVVTDDLERRFFERELRHYSRGF